MKNEVYLTGVVKRVQVYRRYWSIWLTIPRVGVDGTTSVLVVGYDTELGDDVVTNARIEVVGHLGWRRRIVDDDEQSFELVVVADELSVREQPRRAQRNGVDRRGNGDGQRQPRQRQRVQERGKRDDDDIPF